MSASHPSSSPTLGRVRQKSPCANSLTYVPACVRISSVKNRPLGSPSIGAARISCTTLTRVAGARRCRTLVGVACATRSPFVALRRAKSSAPKRRDAHMTAAYVFSFSALPSCIFPYASRELRWTPTTPTPPSPRRDKLSAAARAADPDDPDAPPSKPSSEPSS